MYEANLEKLVKLYIEDVERVCDMMLEGLNLSSKHDLILYRKDHQCGSFALEGINSFTFHGRGCRFSNNQIRIDWDFGCEDAWCGVDPWKLANYAKDNRVEQLADTLSGLEIKNALEKLVDTGSMTKQHDLYYLRV